MSYCNNGIEVEIAAAGKWYKGQTEFTSLDDLRSHMMRDGAYIRIFVRQPGSTLVRETYIQLSSVDSWAVEYDD